MDVVTVTENGLYCAAGNFYIDPWRPVACAVLTHAHGDHARAGSERYFAARAGAGLLRQRLGLGASLIEKEYGEPFEIGAREARAEARLAQSAAELVLLWSVVEAGETDVEPRGPVLLEEAAEVAVAAHRHGRHPFCVEIAAESLGEHANSDSVARPFDEQDRTEG